VSRAGRSEDGQVSNVVEIYDFGELPDGRLWFAMELLQGRSMARMLAEGPMEVSRLIGVLRQLCKGMAAVHDANVIHRDIKPGNIMLVRDRGRDDVVKVVDFGVAAVLAEGDSAEVQLEGTPNYMAPEQAMGSEFDHRLDIYAVGAVAFHMLTGSPPFHGDDVFQLLRRVCTEPPPRPSEVNPAIDIPPALEEVLLRCLQKDPNERYDDMRELEAALCEAQIAAKLVTPWDDLPVPQVEPLARYEALVRGMPKPTVVHGRPGRVRALVAAAAVALALAGAGVFAARQGDASSAVDDRISAGVAAARAAAARAVYLYPPPDEPNARTAYIEVVSLETLAKEVGEDATKAATDLRHEFADTRVRLGARYWDREGGRPFAVDYYISALVFDPTHERASERAPITPGALTELQRKAAALDFAAVELSASEPLLALAEDDEQERVRKLEEIGNKEDEHGLQTEIRIQKLIEQEEAAAGVKPEPAPRKVARRPEPRDDAEPPLGGDDGTDDGSSEVAPRQVKRSAELVQQGLSALSSGKRDRAETLFHRALDQDHRSHRALDGLAQVYFARGDYQKAVSYGKQAVELSGKRGSYRIHLGDAYFKVFRYQEAKAQYRRAQELGHSEAQGRLEKVKSKLGR
ncbi:MAG: protein kinase, partial [Myxococcales bacterium]|nr:protein kinase [Myxococcales bacterium]